MSLFSLRTCHPPEGNLLKHSLIAIRIASESNRARDLKPILNEKRQQIRSGKSQSESSPNFSNFCPEFCPEFLSEFSPNFLRSFRASFRGKRRPEKIHQKSPPFFNAKFPGKFEEKIHKSFLESGQSSSKGLTAIRMP